MTTEDISEPVLGGLGKTSSQLLVILAGRGQRLFTTRQAHDVVSGSMASTRKPVPQQLDRLLDGPALPRRLTIDEHAHFPQLSSMLISLISMWLILPSGAHLRQALLTATAKSQRVSRQDAKRGITQDPMVRLLAHPT